MRTPQYTEHNPTELKGNIDNSRVTHHITTFQTGADHEEEGCKVTEESLLPSDAAAVFNIMAQLSAALRAMSCGLFPKAHLVEGGGH